MKFLVAYKKANKELLKIELDDGQQVWASTSSAVYNFAKSNFEENEEAGFEYTLKNGQYFVSRITKGGTSTQTQEPATHSSGYACEDCGAELKDDKYKKCYNCNKNKKTESSPSKPTCEDCGTELKDAKYKKCYTCNQKNPVKNTSGRSSSTNESIRKQAVLKATCQAIKTLTGRIENVDTLGEMVTELFTRLDNLIK